MITIKAIKLPDAAYETLAANYGSVFNSPHWLALYRGLELYGIYNLNKELIGAFNLFKAAKLGLNYYITPPYSPSNGLFFINPAQNTPNRNTFEKSVHEALSNFFSQLHAPLFITAFPTGFTDMQPYFWNKFKVVPNYTYCLSLQPSEETLFNELTGEKRKSIRKAEKDGVEIRRCEDYKEVKELVLKTFNRKDKTVSQDFLNKILFEFATAKNSFAFVASYQNKLSACTFCVFDGNTSYYLFGGYDDTNKHHGAGVSCMWHSILFAKKAGINTFDFEGSMLPEVERYFREFGGQLTPYYTLQKALLPLEMLLKLKMRNRF